MTHARDQIRLGPIAGVTIVTRDLAACEATYAQDLGYRVVARDQVPEALALTWGKPAAAGLRYVVMVPASGDDFVFRFIEAPQTTPCRAFTRHGWNAAELIVSRVDPLAERLTTSGFEIVAPPRDLSFCADIRAMQLRGPSDEILYLTEFKREVPGLEAPAARCEVDGTFIVIVGGGSLTEMQRYYEESFAVPKTSPMESRVQTMAIEFGLSRETLFKIAALPLAGRTYIEADEMPASAAPLAIDDPELPPGIALVSFRGVLPAHIKATAQRYAANGDQPLYRRESLAGTTVGAAGELIEIIE